MNTPAHLVLSLWALESLPIFDPTRREGSIAAWIAAGAVAPDLPNAVFFAAHRAAGVSAETIYSQLYALPQWQAVLAPSHSVPLALLVLLLARWRAHRGWTAFSLSVCAHLLGDLLTHAGDAHPHLWPAFAWSFASPVSYWDVAHGARWFVPLELAASLLGTVAMWKRAGPRWRRPLLAACCLWLVTAYATGWAFWGSA